MFDHASGIKTIRFSEAEESVILQGLELKLISAGDGTEIIHHKLYKGRRWALYPAEGWEALEFLYILSGELAWHSSSGEHILRQGDSLSAQPILKETIFIAQTDCEFLYVASQPVFHHYSENVKHLMNLAVEIEEKDGYTSFHCESIMNLSMMVGEKMGLSSARLIDLNYGAFLHDIGKVMVPESILCKPGKLTDEEYELMKQHTTWGRKMLLDSGMSSLYKAGIIVEQHHERHDGSGYPHRLTGNEIDICSAIVAVVDSYDAITADRVYKSGRSKEEALRELEHSRSQYHPDVLDTFFEIAKDL